MNRLVADHPVRRHGLDLTQAPMASDHGIPLGNGLVGATLWGDGRPLKISLDRADLWDLRPIEEYARPDYTWDQVARAHAEGRHDDLVALLEAPYGRSGPTKIPAGRIEVAATSAAVRFQLDRATMLARVDFEDTSLEAFIAAEGQGGRLRGTGPRPGLRLVVPPFDAMPPGWVTPTGLAATANDVWELGYPPPVRQAWEGGEAFTQVGWGGFAFAVGLAWREEAEVWEAAWTILTRDGEESQDALAARARAGAEAVLARPFDDALAAHADGWVEAWGHGRVDLPDPVVERTYYSAMGLFNAAARRGAPPIPLQGPWTSDTGRLPPWKGDYHHDLNTQMNYWPAYAGDRLEAAAGFTDWLWRTRGECRAWTRRFYGVEGLNVPMTADLLNRQIGGWRQHTHSVATGAWLAQHFHLQWRYSGDAAFLAERAWPYLNEVCRFIATISQVRDAQGRRGVLLSSSPEIFDNTPRAWFSVLTNYDLSLFRAALGWGAEMAEALGDGDAAAEWRRVAAELPPLALADDGALLIAPGEPLPKSHRHHSHAMAVYPLRLLEPLETAEDARIVDATLAQMERMGTGAWMGYSFAWRAALLARAGRGEEAAADLRTFETAFTFPNGFHANGDWKASGHSKAVFGAFTLEGCGGAAAAVQEMLLQSRPGLIRLFPATPPDWGDLSFEGLRADAAVLVSARMEAGRLASVRLSAERPVTIELAWKRFAPGLVLPLEGGATRKLTRAELGLLGDA